MGLVEAAVGQGELDLTQKGGFGLGQQTGRLACLQIVRHLLVIGPGLLQPKRVLLTMVAMRGGGEGLARTQTLTFDIGEMAIAIPQPVARRPGRGVGRVEHEGHLPTVGRHAIVVAQIEEIG